MQTVSLYSAPQEKYLDHIFGCKEKFELIFPYFSLTIERFFRCNSQISQETLMDCFSKTVLFHDLGKLTKEWQERLGTGSRLPSHSTLGAAYLWKTLPEGLREPLSFAVAIHHSDRGLLGDNIEKPDVQAILDGIVYNNGNIKWHDEIEKLSSDYFPIESKKLNVSDLKDMARGLRVWAKGCNLLEQHQRRLQASLAHHILKLCDISAAVERKEYKKEDDKDYYGGWLMVENIKKYTDNLQIRALASEIKKKFNPQKIILFGSYAYGRPTSDSDIDILIIMDVISSVKKQASLIRRELPSSIPIDIIVRTPHQVEERLKLGDFFIEDIIEKGVEL